MKELSIWVWILLICILFGGPIVYVIFIVGLLVRGYFIIRLLIDDKKQRGETQRQVNEWWENYYKSDEWRERNGHKENEETETKIK